MKIGIRAKIILPAIIMLFAALTIVTVYSYILQKNAAYSLMEKTANDKLVELETSLNHSEQSIKTLKNTLNKNFIRITKSIAEIIALNPEEALTTENMKTLATNIGIDEIHVTDSDGVLQWGSSPGFFGFDFKTSSQSKPFLKALTTDNFELAQEPQPRGADNTLFQYIGVSRIDEPGLIQIGVQPKELQNLIETSSIENNIKAIRLSHSGKAILVDSDGNIQFHENSSLIGQPASKDIVAEFLISAKESNQKIIGNYYVAYSSSNNWRYGVYYPVTEFTNTLSRYLINIFIIVIIIFALCIIFFTVTINKIIKPLKLSIGFANEIADGYIDAKLDINSKDETGELADALGNMLENINMVIKEVHETSETINNGITEFTETTDMISSGASEQAASAEEVSASMEEMSASINQNAGNAKQTEKISENVLLMADDSEKAVRDAMESMETIVNKISVIDEIARNTNLLSLNASIEAARAGEHGKGFAVVATEVGKLSQNSQTAAHEIIQLTNQGLAVAKKASKSLEELIPEIKKTVELVKEISTASAEQGNGVEQINIAIASLDDVIQTNATSSSDLANTAHKFKDLAAKLKQSIDYFKVKEEAILIETKEVS